MPLARRRRHDDADGDRGEGEDDVVSERRPVTWAEAAKVSVQCAVVLAVTWAALDQLGERQLPVAAPLVFVLARWFFTGRRHWGAGLAAAVTGSAVLFVLADRLRPRPDRLLADTVATAVGLAVALAVFTLGSRVRRRA
ncbi:hypothetical protein C1I97_22395 [Streptomyces sp. NTH33]|uniref:hypothetical protein n=1 Tax=Streptomyces sp. NTH33 TaxID=1735453 RepID=UPI000DAA81CC|nr:hypothetical protein [Streptomyces sp. NTH33]PZH01474.1 hypothetical protein C1I97_22395 [Streptomyces sp. NTH33]